MFDHVGRGKVRVGIARPMKIDVNPAEVVGADLGAIAEDNAGSAYRPEFQRDLIIRKIQERANRLHVERCVDVPVGEIFRTTVRNNEIGTTDDSVNVGIHIEKTSGGSFLAQCAGQYRKVGFSALRQQAIRPKFLNEADAVLFSGGGIERANARKRIEGDFVGVVVERFLIEAPQIGFGVKKEIAENHGAEILDGLCELFVGVVNDDRFLQFRHQAGIDWLAAFLGRFEVGPQRAQGRRNLVRFAESDVESRDLGFVFMQRVQKMREVNARKRPLAQNFLRVLIDIYDHDARINGSGAGRTITKAGIQRRIFEALQEIENRRGTFTKEGEEIEREAGNGDGQADQERDAMLPPGEQKFVDAKTAAALGPFRRGVGHELLRATGEADRRNSRGRSRGCFAHHYSRAIKFKRTPDTSTRSPSSSLVGPGIETPLTTGTLSPEPM